MAERPTASETLALVRRLWRRYDLVVSTQAGDRPTFFADRGRSAAGRPRTAARARPAPGGSVTRIMFPSRPSPDSHRVSQLLAARRRARSRPRARHRLPAGSRPMRSPRRALRGPACQPVLPLQALDRPWLARRLPAALAERGLARRGDRRPGPGRTRLSRRTLWEPADPPVVRLSAGARLGRGSPRCCRAPPSMSAPIPR